MGRDGASESVPIALAEGNLGRPASPLLISWPLRVVRKGRQLYPLFSWMRGRPCERIGNSVWRSWPRCS